MTKEIRTQWHPAFCSTVKLELIENKGDLDYENEYNLNSKPIQIDLLVIKKSKYVKSKNEIGKIFLGHNIMEYKSSQDSMNVDTFIKVIASSRLTKENQKWLTLLSSHLNKDDAKRIILQMGNLTEKDEKAYANSVIQVALKENLKSFDFMKGEDDMVCKELLEFMKPEIDEIVRKNAEIERKKERIELIMNCLKKNRTVEEISDFLEIPLEEVQAVASTISNN